MRIVVLAIQMIILTLPAWAEDPATRYVPAQPLQSLRDGQRLTALVATDGRLSLMPTVSSRDAIAVKVAAARPTVGVEMLGMIPGHDMSTPAGWLQLYNVLHAVSSMKGMLYYSVTKNAKEVLFNQSYAIKGIKQATRIPDPVFSTIPAEDSLSTLQEDSSFGRNLYDERYSYRGDHMLLTIENLTSVSFLFVPIIQPGNLVNIFVIVPVGKELFFYGVCYLKTGMPLGDRVSREASLRNRLYAMADWLHAQLDGLPPQK
jgi:hypothetical protein